MINKILSAYAARLEEYLSVFHYRPEGLVTVEPVNNGSEEKHNKIVISLCNVERETGGGIAAPLQKTSNGYIRKYPPLMLNLYVMIAAVYSKKRYSESLSVLSDTLKFVQSTPKLQMDGYEFSIEIINLPLQDMNNIWSILGGVYYPSVLCKIRGVVIDCNEISSSGRTASSPDVGLYYNDR